MWIKVVFLMVSCLGLTDCGHPPSLRHQRPSGGNRMADVNATCDLRGLNVTVRTEKPFKGILFAKDFSQECRAFGTMKDVLTLNLPTTGCGVRLGSDERGMFYEVTVVIQQDKHLRQFTDQERNVKCFVDEEIFRVSSRAMEEAVKREMISEKRQKRTGRNQRWKTKTSETPGTWESGEASQEISVDSSEIRDELNEAVSSARVWMEIEPAQNKDNLNEGTLQVGEEAVLMIKSTLPVGIGWRVVECEAHDGLGDASQRLLDEFGCPIDELLMPGVEMRARLAERAGASTPPARHQEAIAKFAAFKFPDRDRLHLKCGLQLCRDECTKIDCSSFGDKEAFRISKKLREDEDQEDEILDRLEVFNSVEVLAPGIELDEDEDRKKKSESESLRSPFGRIPGDRAFCVSADKMALAFCALGAVFLCAVCAAAFALYRARRDTDSRAPPYTRSLFGSSGASSASIAATGSYGSRLLLRESPCIGSASVRGYGRIL